MKNKSAEKIKLPSIDELLGVVNEEAAMDIEIRSIHSFEDHPFKVVDVLGCLSNNTSKVKNIKKYLLAALFNAPSTMDSYYRAEVNHDMPFMAATR